jgi:hypothetical protein
MSLQLPRLDRAFALLLTVVGVGAAAFTWAQVVRTISEATPPAPTMQATSIVWNDRVFQSPAELARWLRSRGATYTAWSEQHPVGRDLLERRPAIPSGRTHPPARQSKPAGATHTAAKAKPAAKAKRPHRSVAPANRQHRASVSRTATTGAPKRSPAITSPSSAGSPSSAAYPVGRIFIAFLALLAAACAGTAALPRALLQRHPNLARTIAPYRALLLAGAAALMIGIVAGAVLN